MAKTLTLWHGARAWSGDASILPGRKGRSEHGPGIYLTTHYQTARKYAKGGGVTLRFTLDAQLGWLEDANLPLADAEAFVLSMPRVKDKKDILERLNGVAERLAPRLGGALVPASTLVNLLVNADALVGENAPRTAAFLVAHGADASLTQPSREEDWVVLFNPRKILRVERMDAKNVPVETWVQERVTR